MSRRSFVLGLGLLGVVAFSVPALAQPSGASSSPTFPAVCPAGSVTPASSEAAHAFYNTGRALYDEGNYDDAIGQFLQAYRRDCSKHDLLIIISRSYELKGDKVGAVKSLEAYLERVKDSPDAQTHRTKIENMKKQIAASPPASASSSASPSASPTASPSTTPPPAEVREHTLAPWLLVGLGGAAVIAGAVVYATAPSTPSNCNEDTETCERIEGQSNAEYKQNQDDAGRAQSQPTIGIVILAGGAAILGAGLLWHVLEPTGPVNAGATAKAKPKKPLLTPSVAPGYAGLTLGGTF